MKIETIAIHAGNHTDVQLQKQLIQPIVMATTFVRDEEGGFALGLSNTAVRLTLTVLRWRKCDWLN
jgi:O-acetylhomoserine/O-acetylserine sulfhydrylase-like pyridoxal-dependent enzyme